MSGTDLQIETSTRRAYCPDCGDEFPADHEHCPHDGTLLYLYNGPNDEDHLLGESLDGRFKLHRVLGEGGMGKVYAGTQLSVGRNVAIKVLRKELSNDPEIVKRFFREGRVISGLSHHNIVNLVDFGQAPDSGVLFLAMEMLDGRDMSDLMSGQRMTLPLALECVRQTCAGLSQAHEQSIVHRDLKPENLFVVPGSDGSVQVKILDFGIARALETNTKLTKTGMVFGTPQYMPPEQSSGGEIGPHTDIYALGVILFESLTGRLPFDGQTPTQVMLAHIRLEPPSLREFLGPDELPDEVVELVSAMLEKEPSDRPKSVLEVRDAIEQVQREHGMLPVRVATDGEFEARFAPLLIPATGTREQALSGSLRMDTGSGAEKPRTNPPAALEELAMADTAALAKAPGGTTAPASDAELQVSGAPGRRIIATAVLVLAGLAGAVGFYMLSSQSDPSPGEITNAAAVTADKTSEEPPNESAEAVAEPAADMKAAADEASVLTFAAREAGHEASMVQGRAGEPDSKAKPAARAKPSKSAKPSRPDATPSKEVEKPKEPAPARPEKKPESPNFFPVE